MRNAILGGVIFVLFIMLVEWQRRSARVSFDTKVSGASVRRDAPVRPRSGKSRDTSDKSASAAAVVVVADAGPAASGESPEEKAPEDPEVVRKKAEAVVDAIQRLMDSEPRDDTWAAEVESWVKSTCGTPGTRIERVQCKKTLCLVAAQHDSESVFRSWVSRLNGDEKHLRAMTMPTPQDSGKTHTKTFLFREES